jgi:lambda family phage tail tape measure protein
MAKQVSELFIKLGIQGEQELSALRSSFNELSKVTKLSETDLNSIRTRLVEFGREAGNTERVNRGLTDAFRGLLSEASRGSAIWQQLNSDLSKLRQEARLTDTELNSLRDIVVKESSAHKQSSASIKEHIKSLQDLKNQASLNGKLYQQLDADIEKLNSTLAQSTAGNREHYKSLTTILAVKPEKVLKAWQDYKRILDEGTASSEKLAVAQTRLRQLSGAPRILERQKIAQSAEIIGDPEYFKRFGFAGRSLPELPNTNAAYAQQVKELQQDLANLDRTSVAYLQTLMQLADVQRQATEVTQGYAQALLLGLNTGAAARSARNLQEVIAALRAEMQQLDVATSEGAAAYATNANQVRTLERELNQLANSYRHVGDAAAQATTAVSAASTGFTSRTDPLTGGVNPKYVAEQQRIFEDLVAQAEQGIAGALDAAIAAKTKLYEYQAAKEAAVNEEANAAAAELISLQEKQLDLEVKLVEQEYRRLNILEQQAAAAKNALGFKAQQQLSPFYESIVDLSTASVREQQSRMGRSSVEAFNDIVTAFTAGGRPTDLKEKSTYIGESVAAGITKGATDQGALADSAKTFADRLIAAFKKALRIQSPSGESRDKVGIPIGQGIGEGIIQGIQSFKQQIQSTIRDVLATPGRAPLYTGQLGQPTQMADKLQNLIARTSSRTSTYLPYARLLGENVLGSPALEEAFVRRLYEQGGVVPPAFLPASARRPLRGTSGIPGGNLESFLKLSAIQAVSRSGAFTGPLAPPATAPGAVSSLYSSLFAARGGTQVGTGAFPLFSPVSTVPLAQLRTTLQQLGGRSYSLGSTPGGSAADTLSRLVNAASSLSKLATEAAPGLGRLDTVISNVRRELRALNAEPTAYKFPLSSMLLPGGITVNTERYRRASTQLSSYGGSLLGFGSMYSDPRGGTGRYRFPLEGMMGPSSPIGGGSGGYKFPLDGMLGPSGSPKGMAALNATLKEFGPLSQASTARIRALASVLGTLQEELSPLDASYEKVNRAIEKQNVLIERETTRRERRRNRLTLGQGVQAAGAVISGGIFGGPEGFAGGLLGAGIGSIVPGLGTVGGAFAGSAIGGQLGMFRQQLSAATELSSELTRQRTALQGVVYSYSDYLSAVQATEALSRRFNIPLTDTTTQFTRLSAAVLGSGRSIKDSEFALKAVTQAIKGTGGGAEQVQGTLLALTQVFSKGKVSAEELNQIAERLPGTFTTFAQAAGKSGPELQKALQDGKVTIDDLMKFLELLSKKYAKTADDIAKSSQDAGARFTKAFQDLQLTAGSALQGIGSDFQDFGTRVVASLDRIIRKMIELGLIKPGAQYYVAEIEAKRMSTSQLEQRVLEAAARAEEERSSPLYRLFGIGGQAGRLNPVYNALGLQNILSPSSQEADVLEQALKRIRQAEALANKPGGPPPLPGTNGETPEQKRLREQRERDAQVAAEQAQRRNEEIAKQQIRLADNVFKHQMELEERRYQRRKELADLNAQNELRLLFGTERERAAADLRYRQSVEQFDRQIADARREVARQGQALRSAQQMAAVTAGGAGTAAGTLLQQGTGFTPQQLTAATSAAAKFTGVANMCAESVKAFYASLGISLPGVTAWADTVQKAGTVMRDWSKLMPGDIVATGRPGDTPHVGVYTGGSNVFHQSRSRGLRAGNFPDLNYFRGGYFVRPAAAGRQRAAVAAQQNRAIADVGDIDMAQLGLQQAQRTLADLLAERPGFQKAAETTRVLDYSEAIKQQNVELDKELRLLRQRVDLQTQGYTEAYIELQLKVNENTREQAKLEAELLNAEPSKRDAITATLEGLREELRIRRDIYDLQERTKQGFGFREGAKQYVESLGSMKEATSQLTLNGIKGLEDALMDLATTGSANFASFAAEVLKQGARMILQQLVLKPLIQGLANLFNPGAAAASSFSAFSPAALNFGPMGPGISAFSANGNVFASNGIIPYAMGGIVNTPTLFRFANGGVPSTGLMGEAGPEAIIPLRRGSDGKLGVAGGGSTSITINVDAKGSSAEGDPGRAAALGRVITAAVQAELVKQKRPGGLLSR